MQFISFQDIFNAKSKFFLHNIRLGLNQSLRVNFRISRNIFITHMLHNEKFILVHFFFRVNFNDNFLFILLVICKIDFSKTTLAYFLFQYKSSFYCKFFQLIILIEICFILIIVLDFLFFIMNF